MSYTATAREAACAGEEELLLKIDDHLRAQYHTANTAIPVPLKVYQWRAPIVPFKGEKGSGLE